MSVIFITQTQAHLSKNSQEKKKSFNDEQHLDPVQSLRWSSYCEAQTTRNTTGFHTYTIHV